MPTEDDRMAALNALLANGGQGLPGANQAQYDTIVRPVLSAPTSQRAMLADRVMADRNRIVADAARQAVGGYGSALNSARQQTESEWMRRYLAGQKPSGRGGKGPSGAGKDDGGKPTTPTDVTQPTDPWAWVNDYVAANSQTSSAPRIGVGTPAPVTALNKPGGGRAAGQRSRTQPPRNGTMRYS